MVNATKIRAGRALKWGLIGAGVAAVALPALAAGAVGAVVGTLGPIGTAVATYFGVTAGVGTTIASTAGMLYAGTVAGAGALGAAGGALFADGEINRQINNEKIETARARFEARRAKQEEMANMYAMADTQARNLGLVPNAPYFPGNPGLAGPGGSGVGSV